MTAEFTIHAGAPYPLGATWDGRGVNFALFSAHADKVALCLFDRKGRKEIARLILPAQTDQVWHGFVPEARPGLIYGYRVFGPHEPEQGHRFNPNKLLLDPYARAIHGKIRWTDAHYGFNVNSPRGDLSFDRRDNAFAMPKCVVVDESFTWGEERRVPIPWSETVLYEVHVRGFTKLWEALPKSIRGTFAGLGHPKTIAYLRSLGVTSVELMPIQGFVDDRFLEKRGLRNYWGYQPICFFAPESRYMTAAGLYDFKTMVLRLHDAGIEVILDVVYNHTGEADHLGPTLCFRGIDNHSYYRLNPENPRYYSNDTGCGNALDLANPRVLQMVMDSLRYWARDMHVDGFRFDLATTLGREAHGFDPGSGFFDAIRQDPILARTKLIAEPWDIGMGGYQLGNFPPGWAEWNDRARDTFRRFWRGDAGMLPELAKRLHGSGDIFEKAGRQAWSSINYVACHDGFTLADLVSYDRKHNHANGEENRDGHSEPLSANYGEEGPSEEPEILEIRARQRRNLLATVFLAQGTPMIQAGDEMGRSQQGNNNAYCQDNEITWQNWQIGTAERDLQEWLKGLIALRQEHRALRRPWFMHHRKVSAQTGFADMQWFAPNGREMTAEDWENPENRTVGMVLAGDLGAEVADRPFVEDDTLFCVFNAADEAVAFRTPESRLPRCWECRLNTHESHRPAATLSVPMGAPFRAEPRATYVFVLQYTADEEELR